VLNPPRVAAQVPGLTLSVDRRTPRVSAPAPPTPPTRLTQEADLIRARLTQQLDGSTPPARVPDEFQAKARDRADGSNHTVERLQMLGCTGDVPVYYTPGGLTSLPIGQIVPSPSDTASSASRRPVDDILRDMDPVEVSDD
jgi:hypothetical protein